MVSGSQNGQEHSSSRDGVAAWALQGGTDYLMESISTIDFLAGRYADNGALLGIELLNEPGEAVVPFNVLEYYYKWGYSVIRKHTASAYVIMCQRIGGDFGEFVNTLPADNVVLDVHFYNLFNPDLFEKTTAQWNIDFVNNDRRGLLQKLNTAGNALLFVGEWTNEWEVEDASQSDYQRFGAAQLEVFGQATFGWGVLELPKTAESVVVQAICAARIPPIPIWWLAIATFIDSSLPRTGMNNFVDRHSAIGSFFVTGFNFLVIFATFLFS